MIVFFPFFENYDYLHQRLFDNQTVFLFCIQVQQEVGDGSELKICLRENQKKRKAPFLNFFQCFIVARVLGRLGELSKILDNRLSLTEAVIEIFYENGCTFYDRQIILFNIVLSGSSKAETAQSVHQRDLEKLDKLSKSNQLRYVANGSKNKKTKFCRIETPWSGSTAVAYKIHHCNNFY